MKYLVYTLNLLTKLIKIARNKKIKAKEMLLDPSSTNILNAKKKNVTAEKNAQTNQNSNIG